MSRGSGANLARRGNGCVAADVDLDGHTDLYVTSNTYDALLWNRGDGTFSEIAQPAGIATYGWHAGAAVGDVNGDGLADSLIGFSCASPDGRANAGETYVVFGKPGGEAVELSEVAAGTGGFVVRGIDADDGSRSRGTPAVRISTEALASDMLRSAWILPSTA